MLRVKYPQIELKFFHISSYLNFISGRLKAKTGYPALLNKPCSHTSSTQFCKRKTNIYLYKDFCFLFILPKT